MSTKLFRVLAPLALVLLQLGCAAGPAAPRPGAPAIAATDLVKTTASWDGAPLPAYPQAQPEVTIRRIVIPAGARLETHSHPVINAGVLTAGRLTVVTESGKTLRLKAGDPIVEVVNTWHYGVNEGDTPAEIVVFYAGAVGMPIAVAKPQ